MKDFEKIDKLLWQAISSNNEPDESLNQKIISEVKERNRKKYPNRKIVSTVAIAILIAATSISVFAIWNLLTSNQVAENLGNKSLSIAFEGEDAVIINQTQKSCGYKVTLLGIVSGKNISDFESTVENIYPGRTYAVVAIENDDGKPMPDLHDKEYRKVTFFVSPLIKGQNPKDFNIFEMNGGYSQIVKDGIMYRIVECDNIEIFADRGLYLSVISSTSYDVKAYNFNTETGKITRNTDYEGVNILFDLPIDPSKGNYEKAEKYLKELTAQQTTQEKIDIECLLAESTIIQDSVQEVIPDEKGMITYKFDGNKLKADVNRMFKEGQIGLSDNYYIDNNKILVFSRDKEGVVTVMTYMKK